jgi:hypothetical protein
MDMTMIAAAIERMAAIVDDLTGGQESRSSEGNVDAARITPELLFS